MRPALLLCGLFALLVGAVIAVAQTGSGQAAAAPVAPKEMIVTRDVEVRCGGTPDYYVTTKLKRGDKVLVIDESTKFKGWLAIKPPAGSFSWINALFVKRLNQQSSGVVVASENEKEIVPVLAGSSLMSNRPNVEVVKVARGTQVLILGNPMTADDGLWLPIQPTPREVRYIPVDAVQTSGTTVPGTLVAATPGVGPIAATPPNPARVLRNQADQALAASNLAQAKALYEQAANQTADLSEKSYCYNRLHQIATAGQPTNYAQPGHPTNTAPPGQAPGQVTSLYSTTAATAPATQVSYAAAAPPRWQWGTLQRTTIPKDGQPMYALMDRNGQVLMYALSPNISLEHYLNRLVCLYGPVTYSPGDYLRISYMTVSHVALP